MNEPEFRAIPGLERYEVARDGRVRDTKTPGRILPQSRNTAGKLRVVLTRPKTEFDFGGRSSRNVDLLVALVWGRGLEVP
jgi:hypothetical protein